MTLPSACHQILTTLIAWSRPKEIRCKWKVHKYNLFFFCAGQTASSLSRSHNINKNFPCSLHSCRTKLYTLPPTRSKTRSVHCGLIHIFPSVVVRLKLGEAIIFIAANEFEQGVSFPTSNISLAHSLTQHPQWGSTSSLL